MRTLLLIATIILAASPVNGQINIPNTFVPQTRILSSDVNENFTELGAKSLNRTGGTMAGTLTTQLVVPDGNNTRALGASGTRWSTIFGVLGDYSGTLGVSGVATFASNATIAGTLGVSGGTFTTTLTVTDTGATAIDVNGGINAGSGNVAIIGADGRIPAINSTNFASLSGANITGLLETNITDGSILARVGSSETISGAWTFSAVGNSFTGGLITITSAVSAGLRMNANGVGGNDDWRLSATNVGEFNIAWEAGSGPSLSIADDVNTLFITRPNGAGNVGLRISNGTDSGGLSVNDSTGILHIQQAGVSRALVLSGSGTSPQMQITDGVGTFGTGSVTGATMIVGRNGSGNAAAGTIGLQMTGGGVGYIWADNTGVIRTAGGAPPEEDGTPGDTSGTVVGTQTSTRASKNIFGEFTDNRGALETILQTPLWNFNYRNGAYNHQSFVGITTEDSPVFGMDEGRSFNPVNAFGMTVGAIKELERRIKVLESK